MASWLIGLMMAVAALSSQQGIHPTKWWESPDVRSHLQLTDEQVRRIDQLYNSSFEERGRYAEEVERLTAELDKLIDSPTATEEAVTALAAQLGESRARRNKARTLMLYRMYQVLTPAQRTLLKQLVEEREGRKPTFRADVRQHP
jgi:Spy/CpxP family protein refolding chaperone